MLILKIYGWILNTGIRELEKRCSTAQKIGPEQRDWQGSCWRRRIIMLQPAASTRAVDLSLEDLIHTSTRD